MAKLANKSVKTSEQKVMDVNSENRKGETVMNELQQELNLIIDGTNEVKKGEKAMTTSNTKTKSTKTVWDYTKEAIAKGFIESGLKTEFDVKIKRYFDEQFTDFKTGERKTFEGAKNVFNYLTYLNGIDKVQFEDIKYVKETVNKTTGEVTPGYYLVKVKNFNPTVKAKSKRTGNMYNYFFKELGMLCQYDTKATA